MLKFAGYSDMVRRYLVQAPATLLCLLYIVVFFTGDWNPSDDFSLLILVIIAIKCGFKGRAEPLDFALTVGLFYLFVMPCISLATVGIYKHVIIAAISSPLFDFFSFACRRMTLAPRRYVLPSRVTRLEYFSWCVLVGSVFILGGVLPPSDIGKQLTFNVPFALSLVIFEKVCRLSPKRQIYLMICGYLVAVIFYVNFYWTGFGRIVIGSYILIPLFIAHYWRDIGLRVWQAVIAAPVAIYVANLSRHDENASFADMHSGSIGAHLIMTRDLLNQIDYWAPIGWSGFWHQWMLIFLQWFPRELWPSKPLGVGRGYVDMGFLDVEVSAGHSVALGYIGEAVFYLGNEAALGVILTVVTLILARYAVSRVGQGYVAPILAFDVFLITFVWGGMGSFGGRVAFFVLPMLAVIFLRRCRLRDDDWRRGNGGSAISALPRAQAPR